MKARDSQTGTFKDVYVKALDSMPVGTQIEYIGDTIPIGWEEVYDYSTDEIDTGKKWIDGKHIYSKTIIVNRTSGSSLSYHITFDSTGNVNTIINVIGIAKKGNMAWPFYRVNDNDQYRYYIYNYSKGEIEVSTGSNYPGDTHTANITMYYTKTTD